MTSASVLRTLAENIAKIKHLSRGGSLIPQSMCSGITTRQILAGISTKKLVRGNNGIEMMSISYGKG